VYFVAYSVYLPPMARWRSVKKYCGRAVKTATTTHMPSWQPVWPVLRKLTSRQSEPSAVSQELYDMARMRKKRVNRRRRLALLSRSD